MQRLTFALFLFLSPILIFGACPNGGFEWQNKCYFFIANGTGFPEAEINCEDMGGHLASIHDGFTNALLTEHASDTFSGGFFGSTNFWVGLSNVKTSKNLTWMDGSKIDYSDWDKNQPGNSTGIKCVAVVLKTGYWRAETCYTKRPYVCETAATPGSSVAPPKTTTKKPTAPPTTTAPAGKCTGNFTYYGPTNSCFGVFFTFDPDARGWNASETFCQSINGHLASVHSQDEFNFIMNFNYPQNSEYWPWVGLFSKDNEQTWQWTDGTPMDFLPWGPGEPYVDTNFNCVFANSAGIDTLDCSEPGTALCKVKAS